MEAADGCSRGDDCFSCGTTITPDVTDVVVVFVVVIISGRVYVVLVLESLDVCSPLRSTPVSSLGSGSDRGSG